MAFRIQRADTLRDLEIRTHRLSPAEAEIHAAFTLTADLADGELRGRLMGPRCPYTSTVEVPYPLRPFPQSEASARQIRGRIVIPEPSCWDPVAPSLYQGPLELWSGGQPLVQVQVSHGLFSSQIDSAGLHWNGRRLLLHACEADQATEAEWKQWHSAGVNALIAPFDTRIEALADRADALGCLLLVRLTAVPDTAMSASLAQHVCSLGWLVPQELWQEPASRQMLCKLARENRQFLGVEVRDSLAPELAETDFLACDREALPALSTLAQPKLIVGSRDEPPLAEQGILGFLRQEPVRTVPLQ